MPISTNVNIRYENELLCKDSDVVVGFGKADGHWETTLAFSANTAETPLEEKMVLAARELVIEEKVIATGERRTLAVLSIPPIAQGMQALQADIALGSNANARRRLSITLEPNKKADAWNMRIEHAPLDKDLFRNLFKPKPQSSMKKKDGWSLW